MYICRACSLSHGAVKLAHMLAVTNGVGAVGGLALASRIINWLDKPTPLSFLPSHWRFDGGSFALGLVTGLLLFLIIEVWFTVKWAVLSWLEKPHHSRPQFVNRPPSKPLYKIC